MKRILVTWYWAVALGQCLPQSARVRSARGLERAGLHQSSLERFQLAKYTPLYRNSPVYS